MRGEAELVFYSYERNRYNRHHIKTAEEAKEFYNNHKNRCRKGGGTNIQQAVEESIDEILTMDGCKPEIAVVCDGQDHMEMFATKGVKVHSFIIGEEHDVLRKLCVKSGGSYFAKSDIDE